jgi:hypothetical protein
MQKGEASSHKGSQDSSSARERFATVGVDARANRSYGMLKHLLAGGLVLAFIAPALAEGFYIVRGPEKKCTVVAEKPTTTTTTVVGNTTYTTRSEAETAIKKVCTD